jgi:hypothetical protein
MHLVFFEAYDWPPFLIAPIASIVGMAIAAAFDQLVLRPLLGARYPSVLENPSPTLPEGTLASAPLEPAADGIKV